MSCWLSCVTLFIFKWMVVQQDEDAMILGTKKGVLSLLQHYTWIAAYKVFFGSYPCVIYMISANYFGCNLFLVELTNILVAYYWKIFLASNYFGCKYFGWLRQIILVDKYFLLPKICQNQICHFFHADVWGIWSMQGRTTLWTMIQGQNIFFNIFWRWDGLGWDRLKISPLVSLWL